MKMMVKTQGLARRALGACKLKARKARMILASALLLSGPVSGAGKAHAEDKPEAKPSITMDLGVGYSRAPKDVRGMLIMGSDVPLPLSMRLSASAGMSASLNNGGSANLEELRARLTAPPLGPVSVSAGFFRSVHDAVGRGAVNASVFMGLPFGAAGVSAAYLLDMRMASLLGIVVWKAHPALTLSAVGGPMADGSAAMAGGGVDVSLGRNRPSLGLDSWNVFNRHNLPVSNLKLVLKHRF